MSLRYNTSFTTRCKYFCLRQSIPVESETSSIHATRMFLIFWTFADWQLHSNFWSHFSCIHILVFSLVDKSVEFVFVEISRNWMYRFWWCDDILKSLSVKPWLDGFVETYIRLFPDGSINSTRRYRVWGKNIFENAEWVKGIDFAHFILTQWFFLWSKFWRLTK